MPATTGVKMSGSEKKVNRNTYNIFPIKRVTRKFLEVSLCSRAKQRHKNIQKGKKKKVVFVQLERKCAARVNFFFLLVIRNDYHLYGKTGNSGEKSNGTVLSCWKFSGKKVIPFEVLPFSRFQRNNRNFLYHLFGLPVSGFKSRESEKFTGIL